MARKRPADLLGDLRRRIVDGEIAPGEKLPSESALIERWGLGRSAVREVLARLQAEGLVHTRRGAGSFALTPPARPTTSLPAVRTLEDRLALLEYRIALESESAALAAARISGPELAALEDAVDRCEKAASNPAEAVTHDFAFHRGVAAATGNAFLLDAVDKLGAAMIAMPRARLETAAGSGAGDEHRAVLDALRDGDPSAAAAAMRTHLSASKRRLRGEAGHTPR